MSDSIGTNTLVLNGFQVTYESAEGSQWNPFCRSILPKATYRTKAMAVTMMKLYELPKSKGLGLVKNWADKEGDCQLIAFQMMQDYMMGAPVSFATGIRNICSNRKNDFHVFNIVEGDIVIDASNGINSPPIIMMLDDYIELLKIIDLEVYSATQFARLVSKGAMPNLSTSLKIKRTAEKDYKILRNGRCPATSMQQSLRVFTKADFAMPIATTIPERNVSSNVMSGFASV